MSRGAAAACRDGAVASRLCRGRAVCSGLTGQNGFLVWGRWACAGCCGRSGGRIHSQRPRARSAQEGKTGRRGWVKEWCVQREAGSDTDPELKQQRPRHWPAATPGTEEWRPSGSGALDIQIKWEVPDERPSDGDARPRGARRDEFFAGSFPAPPISSQRSVLAQSRWHRAGQPKHRENHETDYVGGSKRQAGVDRVGNWRNERQVLPLYRLRRGGLAGACCLSDSTGRFVLRRSAELVLSAGGGETNALERA
jgi:hypothetical protein